MKESEHTQTWRKEEDLHSLDLCRAEDALLPGYESPFLLYDESGSRSSHLRHNSNLIELFFDLFLSADLATFVATHSIVDGESLIAFIGFFIIIWSTWFQITLHDVRFAQDSVFERSCKFLQFITFVAFALVGANFKQLKGGSEVYEQARHHSKEHHKMINFWLLSFTLFFSRLLLAFQYLVVFLSRGRPARLKTPLLLNVIVFLLSSSIFVGCMGFFAHRDNPSVRGATLGYIVWYLLLVFEVISVLLVSMFWKELGFEYTHLTERMGLLTFVMIGEGAIGACKTTIEIMGDRRLEAEPILLIICIVLVLVLLWTTYFDGLPVVPHGSIWQQVWACLHLPLHLAFVGVLEGSRQVAMIRYISHSMSSFMAKTNAYCLTDHLDGKELGDKLLRLVDSYDISIMHATADESERIRGVIHAIVNTGGICSQENTEGVTSLFDAVKIEHFAKFKDLLFEFAISLFIADGAEELEVSDEKDAFALIQTSVNTVYLYYWASVLALLLTSISMYWLNISRRLDIADWCSVMGRVMMALLATILIALYSDAPAWTSFISSRGMLPTLCGILTLVVTMDWIGRRLRLRGLRKQAATAQAERLSWASTDDKEIKHDLEQSGESSSDELATAKGARRKAVIKSARFSVYDWLMPAYDHSMEPVPENSEIRPTFVRRSSYRHSIRRQGSEFRIKTKDEGHN